MRTVVIAAVLLAGCKPAPAPTSTTPTPVEPTPVTPTDPAQGPTTTGLGEKCSADDACPTGQTCVTYYGIAGANGPAFKSCEIKCAGKGACPDGTACITIADGPGQVCRPSAE